MQTPKEAESIKLHAVPSAAGLGQWKRHLRKEVVSASGYPEQVCQWITRTEILSFEQLADSKEFSTLDANLAAAFSIIATVELASKNLWEKERLG